VRSNLIVAVVAVSVAVALAFFARAVRASETTSAYSHGETNCLQGNDGPGLRLRLRQNDRCGEGGVTYPYLQIDIRELPIAAHKNIRIGADNWARKCASPDEACEESLGGTITFEHFQETDGKHIQVDGSYKLRFRTGAETGQFKVDCLAPCG
jgi:hypothetical protein